MITSKHIGTLCIAIASILGANAAMAVQGGQSTGTLTVSATVTAACEVSEASSINFGSFAALSSAPDQTADSGSSFQVACSTDATPRIYASGERSMVNGENSLPFNLSLASGAEMNDLPYSSEIAQPLEMNQDGDMNDVVLYARTRSGSFKSLPSGNYSTDLTIAVVY